MQWALFNDESEDWTEENAVEAGFYSEQDAIVAVAERYSEEDELIVHCVEEPEEEEPEEESDDDE